MRFLSSEGAPELGEGNWQRTGQVERTFGSGDYLYVWNGNLIMYLYLFRYIQHVIMDILCVEWK